MNRFSTTSTPALSAPVAATALPECLPGMAVAVLAAALAPEKGGADFPPGCNMQLFPDGEFSARDGRPASIKGSSVAVWRLDAAIAQAIISDWQSRKTPLVVDYEHQTMLSDANGQPAPASGWIENLVYLAGRGLFAAVKWTEKAQAHIAAGEYRYISPVFTFDKKTGAIARLHNAALTNNPALDGLAAVALRRLTPTVQERPMNENVLALLRKTLGLPENADETAIMAALTALGIELVALRSNPKPEDKPKDGDPDPAYLTALATLQGEVTALRAELAAERKNKAAVEVNAQIDAALKDGRLPASLKEWAITLGTNNPVALAAYLEKATPLEALKGMQTDKAQEKDKDGNKDAVTLTADEQYAATQLGIDPKDYAKMKENS